VIGCTRRRSASVNVHGVSTSDSTPPTSRFARIARWCARHRWQTISLWILAVAAAIALGQATGTKDVSNFRLPGTESQRAYDVLAKSAPQDNGGTDQLVFTARGGSLRDATARRAVERALAKVRSDEIVAAVSDPLGRGGQITSDGRTGVAVVTYRDDFDAYKAKDFKRIQEDAFAARGGGVGVEHGGLGAQLVRQSEQSSASEGIGLLAAAIVLLITFGSVIAAGIPLLTALLALGTTIGLVPVISQVVDTPDFSAQLAALIGLGVGVDYALIVVTRYRAEHAAGLAREDAIVRALDTAGRTVFFAACTVIIALLGLLLLGLSFLHGPALASALAVLLTMTGALTVLPALLSRAGDWIDRLHLPLPWSRRKGTPAVAGESEAWSRWAQFIQRRPWPAAIGSVLILLALAAPALGMRLGSSDASLDPKDSTSRKAYDQIAGGFGPGVNGTFLIAAELPKAGGTAAARRIAAAVRSDPGVSAVTPPRVSRDGRVAVITAVPRTGPQDEATTNLLNRLRDDVLPPVERRTGVDVSIGGQTASQEDFSRVIANKLPLFVGLVVLFSMLLLLAVFRSIFVPVKAALLNLLSIGAALGFVTLVFQEGVGADLLGVGTGPIESFVPVMLFAIVFGLSMDYEVFLMSRVHEAWTHGASAGEAVRTGLANTGRVITAAAAIMIVVFASFAISGERVITLFGLGLGMAVLLDALIIRCLLVPALMQIMGARAWWMPTWLERRLPRLALERE
jgi:RND superfamily putative drug exporter